MMGTLVDVPEFLKPKEPAAIYSYWSTGRLMIVKDSNQISLLPDDLMGLRNFFAIFDREGAQ